MLLRVVALASPAAAQGPPDYGFTWATITHPGNRPANMDEAPRLFPPYQPEPWLMGQVNHEYRISVTEVSVTHWFEFVQAYAPHWQGAPGDLNFTGFWIRHQGGQYVIRPGADNRPTDMSWRVAARYVNWLHNDKRLEREAFESGVYDTSTFSTNPDGTINDQREHSPDARFWIPTLDEWTKAVYYDPNRYGEGVEGYWLYPNGTNTPLIPGYPEDGGETSAGLDIGAPNARWLDIGSYPHVRTPWGLLDASGGVVEWTETINIDSLARVVRSTQQFDPSYEAFDRIDRPRIGFPHIGGPGLRLASVVPSPGSLPVLLFVVLVGKRRRRRQ